MPNDNMNSGDLTRFEAIIELLFGDQIRKYDTLLEEMGKQIEKLEKQLNENKKDNNNKLLSLSAEIAGNISNLDKTITDKMKNNNSQISENLNQLKKAKVDKKILAEKLSILIDAVT